MRFVLALALVTGCTTVPELPHCDDVIKEQVSKLGKEGFEIIGGQDFIQKDGVVSLGKFLNVKREEGVLAAVVDTELMVEFLEKQEFRKEQDCQRGGKRWYVLSRKEIVKMETN